MSSFEEYFKAIGIGEPIQKRIAEIFAKIKILYPNEEFVDVSISDYLDEDGVRHFTDIRFYSNKIGVKADDFLIKEKFTVNGLCKDILAINVEPSNYDFVQANENSRLIIKGYLNTPPASVSLHGIGANCDYLFEIYKKYLLPRLVLPC
jgi:hypothetical protein